MNAPAIAEEMKEERAAGGRIYIVGNTKTGVEIPLWANSQAQALSYVARKDLTVKVAKHEDLARVLPKVAGKIDDARVEQQLPTVKV